MRRVMLLTSAMVGLIIGAGFASGQEVLQYFTSFGLVGLLAAVVSTVLFIYIGMMLLWIGSKTKAKNHREVIQRIVGKNVIGQIITWAIDVVLILTLFGLGVVMIAGGGSNLEQQFGIPAWTGSLFMLVLVIIIGMLQVDAVVKVIGYITPFIILFIVVIAAYSLFTMNQSVETLDNIATSYRSAVPNWFLSGVNYVSLNIGLGASMMIVMGSNEDNPKTAALGGIFGGIALGIMIALSHMAIFSKIDAVGDYPLPMLGIVNEIASPLGYVMSIVIFLMIFNTAIGMFYSLSGRFTDVGSGRFKILYTILALLGFAVSFVGFTELVSLFYPIMGYMGLLLIGVLIYAPFKIKFQREAFYNENVDA